MPPHDDEPTLIPPRRFVAAAALRRGDRLLIPNVAGPLQARKRVVAGSIDLPDGLLWLALDEGDSGCVLHPGERIELLDVATLVRLSDR